MSFWQAAGAALLGMLTLVILAGTIGVGIWLMRDGGWQWFAGLGLILGITWLACTLAIMAE